MNWCYIWTPHETWKYLIFFILLNNNVNDLNKSVPMISLLKISLIKPSGSLALLFFKFDIAFKTSESEKSLIFESFETSRHLLKIFSLIDLTFNISGLVFLVLRRSVNSFNRRTFIWDAFVTKLPSWPILAIGGSKSYFFANCS